MTDARGAMPWPEPVRGVRRALVLGDQQALCAGSRARDCPVPGHPCLSGTGSQDVVRAVKELAGEPDDRRDEEAVR